MDSNPIIGQPAGTNAEIDQTLHLLSKMHRDEFLLSVERAKAAALDATHVRDGMLLWAERLLPHLESDPHATIAQALELYRVAQAAKI